MLAAHNGGMAEPLRCHLLIGPPASGKTTLAQALAPLLSADGASPALVLSTDVIRSELFGDAAVQGPWLDIETRLQQRIAGAGAAVLGGNVGESALVAGAGALAGREIAKATNKNKQC